jgi:hypothetical protein
MKHIDFAFKKESNIVNARYKLYPLGQTLGIRTLQDKIKEKKKCGSENLFSRLQYIL